MRLQSLFEPLLQAIHTSRESAGRRRVNGASVSVLITTLLSGQSASSVAICATFGGGGAAR